MSLVEMKNVNALIKNKSFFDQPIKDKPETYEKPVEMLLKMIIQQEIYQIPNIIKITLNSFLQIDQDKQI